MKLLSLVILSCLIACSHQPSSRNIASTTPVIRALVKTLAKEVKLEASIVSKRLLDHVKLHAEDYGISATMASKWSSLDDIPVHLRKSIDYELFNKAPAIFKLNKEKAELVLKDIKLGGNKISPLQEKYFTEATASSRVIRARSYEKQLMLSPYKDPKIKAAYSKTFDNLVKNASNSQEVAIAKQIMTRNSEIYSTTGHNLIASEGCESLGGISVYSNLNRTVARVADDAEKGIIKTPRDMIDAVDEELAIATNRTAQESKYARCVLAGRKISSGSGKACRVFNPALAVDCN